MSEFEQAKREWEDEVDAEAASLIKGGMSPWVAKKRAAERVNARRQGRPLIEPMMIYK